MYNSIPRLEASEVKKQYEALNGAYTFALEVEVGYARTELNSAISKATATKNNVIAYNEAAPNDYQSQLDTYVKAADAILRDSTYATPNRAAISAFRKAAKNLAENETTVLKADSTYAVNTLKTAITQATTYMTNTVAPVSTVIADQLNTAITTAKGIYTAATATPATKTAKDVKTANETLATSKNNAANDLNNYKSTTNFLAAAIENAKTAKESYDKVSVGAKAALQDAIDAAQTVLDSAKVKTTEQIEAAVNSLNDAKTATAATNAMAITLNSLITDALTAKNTVVNQSVKDLIQKAIDAVKPDLNNKEKTASDLENDYNTLKANVAEYENSDITVSRAALTSMITKATTTINDVLVYEESKTELTGYKETASTALSDATATPKQLNAATDALSNKIDSIVKADADRTLTDLKAAVAAAKAKRTEVAAINTVIAESILGNYIREAEALVENGTAKARLAKAKEYANDVLPAVLNKLNGFNTTVYSLEASIDAAKRAKEGYAATHTGVIQYATEAIAAAQKVLDAKRTTDPDDIAKALTASNNAKTAADKANTAATNLETAIATAETIKATIATDSIKSKFDTAIKTAKNALTVKTNLETELKAAQQTLESTVAALVNDDNNIARQSLSQAITDANTAKAGLAYEENKTALGSKIADATEVKDNTESTAKILNETTDKFVADKDSIVAADLKQVTDSLGADIKIAKKYESELKAYADSLSEYPAAKAEFATAVISGLSNGIGNAETVQAAQTSTGKNKLDAQTALNDSLQTSKDAYKLYFDTQLQNLADEYSSCKSFDIKIRQEVDSLAELGTFDKAYDYAEDVYASIKENDNPNNYGIVEVIKARLQLVDAKTALTKAYTAWANAAKALNDKIVEAREALETIQLPVHQSIADTLNTAIGAAQGVYDAKKQNTTAKLKAATETLDAAIKAAIEADTKWILTDANATFKQGTYAAGNVTYTRSGSAIAEGNYGTFCLPFEVATSNFKAAYRPIEVSVLSADGNTLTLFLNEVEATAIVNVAADAESGNGKIYTIDGKAANSMSNKGIYVINGKKFVK